MAIKRPDTPLAATVTDSVKKTPVFFNKRKAIREMRTVAKKNPDGTTESHKMSWTGDPNKKRGNYAVFPTITPLKGKEKSSDPKDWTTQTAKEAEAKGELIKVNSKRRFTIDKINGKNIKVSEIDGYSMMTVSPSLLVKH